MNKLIYLLDTSTYWSFVLFGCLALGVSAVMSITIDAVAI